MRQALPSYIMLIVALIGFGCQSAKPASQLNPVAATSEAADAPVAYLDGRPVTKDEVYQLTAQAYGDEALVEILLDRAIADRLSQERIVLTEGEIQAEVRMLLAALSENADEAARLLQEMRATRGLDAKRYDAMLRRNAGLRKLVHQQVAINNTAIEQAYQLRFGPRYRVRLIVTDQLSKVSAIRRQALEGSAFTDLAIEYSIDPSAAQGGLLSPISPADATYPKAIRDALIKLNMDATASRLSPAIAMDNGYALLWLEGIMTTEGPPLEQVRAELETMVRSELERLRMRQLAQALIAQTNVVLLDPKLEEAWKRRGGMFE